MNNPRASISIFVAKQIDNSPANVNHIAKISDVFRPIDYVKQAKMASPIVPPIKVSD